jgi:hypothetical protein
VLLDVGIGRTFHKGRNVGESEAEVWEHGIVPLELEKNLAEEGLQILPLSCKPLWVRYVLLSWMERNLVGGRSDRVSLQVINGCMSVIEVRAEAGCISLKTLCFMLKFF